MTAGAARRIVLLYFVAYTVALTYPGIMLANRIGPLIFGLPLPLFWIMAWVSLSGPVLWFLWRVERNTREGE